jgi:hypothetical protein
MNKMNVLKTVIEVIDGVEKEFVMIEINEYNNYMLLTNPLYEKMTANEREQKQEEIERRRIEKNEETEEKRMKKSIIKILSKLR